MVVLVEVVLPGLPHEQRIGGPGGARPVAVGLGDRACDIRLRDQPLVGIDKVRPDPGDLLPEPSSEGVVIVARYQRAGAVGDLGEAVLYVVEVVGDGAVVVLLRRVAVCVVAERDAVVA